MAQKEVDFALSIKLVLFVHPYLLQADFAHLIQYIPLCDCGLCSNRAVHSASLNVKQRLTT